MKLIESTEQLSESEGLAIINECLRNVRTLGPKFDIDLNEFKFVGFFESTGRQGTVGLGIQDNKFIQVLSLNKFLLRRGLEEHLKNTIYHEFCHYYQNRDLIASGAIMAGENNNIIIVNQAAFDENRRDQGHDSVWLSYAEAINNVFTINEPITAYCSFDVVKDLLKANDDLDVIFEIYCEKCGFSQKFLAVDPEELPLEMLCVIYFHTQKREKNKDTCKKCNGTLYINIVDPDFKAFLDTNLESFLQALTVRKLFGGTFGA